MAEAHEDVAQWLSAARSGCRDSLGRVLEACRPYLLRVAGRRLADDLKAKGSASDVVQQTFLEAQQDFDRFAGSSRRELLAWLRRVLLNNLANFQRHYRATDKRRLDREVHLDPAGSDPGLGGALPAPTPTPSKEAMQREQAEALGRALQQLPEEYRRVLALRQQEHLTFEEIGQVLGRSKSGAQALWLRALERLKREVEGGP